MNGFTDIELMFGFSNSYNSVASKKDFISNNTYQDNNNEQFKENTFINNIVQWNNNRYKDNF